MGSVQNQNPWAPYGSYKDCSQAICSRYCPQWCYIIFPPPPNLYFSDNSRTTFSPLIIALICILASGFLLISYYIIIRKYCRSDRHSSRVLEEGPDQIRHHQSVVASAGLDETFIRSITVFKYKKGDGLIEGTECAVCLNEFQENENLRLLTNCTHAFHLPCIDTWLKTHSNCPLCRSTAAPTGPPVPGVRPPPTSSQTSSTRNVSSLEIHRQNDLVLVVEDCERGRHDEVVITFVTNEPSKGSNTQGANYVQNPEMRNNVAETDQEGVKHFRRSISLGTFPSRRNLLIADILKIDEDDDIQELSISGSEIRIASSEQRQANSSAERSVDTHEKGKNSIIPH